MELFSDFERTAELSELRRLSLFEAFDQAPYAGAATFREMCNDWFSRFPSSERVDLKGRFTSSDDDVHKSAWFELLLHEPLLRLRLTTVVHPEVTHTTKRPDFLGSGKDRRFFLEAVAVSATADRRRVTAAEETVFGWIDETLQSFSSFLTLPGNSPASHERQASCRRSESSWTATIELRSTSRSKTASGARPKRFVLENGALRSSCTQIQPV